MPVRYAACPRDRPVRRSNATTHGSLLCVCVCVRACTRTRPDVQPLPEASPLHCRHHHHRRDHHHASPHSDRPTVCSCLFVTSRPARSADRRSAPPPFPVRSLLPSRRLPAAADDRRLVTTLARARQRRVRSRSRANAAQVHDRRERSCRERARLPRRRPLAPGDRQSRVRSRIEK